MATRSRSSTEASRSRRISPDVEHLHGDRKDGLELLAGRSWDAVLDTCAFVPREVRELAEAIGDRIGHYTLVSSLSVHPDDLPVGATEDTPDPSATVPGHGGRDGGDVRTTEGRVRGRGGRRVRRSGSS